MKKKPPLVRGTEFSDDHRVHLLQGAEELFPALIEAMEADGWRVRLDKWTVGITPPPRPVGVFTLTRA